MLVHLNELIAEGKYKEADDYAKNVYLPERVKIGIEHISKYNRVYSNRLHGAILAILLGKETYIIDNSYGKNSHYYDSWLKKSNKIHLLSKSKSFNFERKKRFLYHMILGMFSK